MYNGHGRARASLWHGHVPGSAMLSVPDNSQSVINNLKQIFTEIGVRRSIVTDGGTQFTSQEFKDFMQTWNIEHRVTSPTNA